MEANFCSACGTALKESSNFCPYCGKRLAALAKIKQPLQPKHFAAILFLSLVIFTAGWTMQNSLGGEAPTKEFVPDETTTAQVDDDESLKELREAAKAAPENVAAWVSFAQALTARIRSTTQPPAQTVFEAIGALRHILDRDPKNSFALIAMADLSFEQQAFSKAVEFYKSYLELEPDDVGARARYASTLSLLQQNAQALEELKKALTKEPENFHANAYAAITYAQLGDFDSAKKYGEKAVSLAPSDEARRRFSDFLSSLKTQRGNVQKEPSANGSPTTKFTQLPEDAARVVDAVTANPVAGPKFSGSEIVDRKLQLRFENFPMNQMPPFVKDKFLQKLKDAAGNASNFDEIVFVEKTDGSQMEQLKLK